MANLRITEILLMALTWLIQKKSESIDYTPDVADLTVVTYRTLKKQKTKSIKIHSLLRHLWPGLS